MESLLGAPVVDEMLQSWHSFPASSPVEFAVRVAGCFPTQGGGSRARVILSHACVSGQVAF